MKCNRLHQTSSIKLFAFLFLGVYNCNCYYGDNEQKSASTNFVSRRGLDLSKIRRMI